MPRMSRGRASQVSLEGSRGMEGMHVLCKDARARLVFADWKTKLPAIFHAVPAIYEDENGARFIPYRDDIGPAGLTNWFVRLNTIHRIGTADVKQTFNLCDPYDVSVDRDSLPYSILYRRLREGAKRTSKFKVGGKVVAPAELDVMFGSQTNRDAKCLSSPNDVTMYVQVLTYYNRDKDVRTDGLPAGAGPGDEPQYLMLKKSAAKSLEKLLEVPSEFGDGGDDYAAQYLYGDITRLDEGGQFLIPYNLEEHSISQLEPPKPVGEDDFEEEDDAGGQQSFGKGYGVGFLSKPFIPTRPGRGIVLRPDKIADPRVQDCILNNYRGIEDKFDIPTPEEQAIFCAKAFANQGHLIEFAFADTEYFTDDVRAIVRSRKQFAAPGNIQTDNEPEVDEEYYGEEEVAAPVPQQSSSRAPQRNPVFEHVDDSEEMPEAAEEGFGDIDDYMDDGRFGGGTAVATDDDEYYDEDGEVDEYEEDSYEEESDEVMEDVDLDDQVDQLLEAAEEPEPAPKPAPRRKRPGNPQQQPSGGRPAGNGGAAQRPASAKRPSQPQTGKPRSQGTGQPQRRPAKRRPQ